MSLQVIALVAHPGLAATDLQLTTANAGGSSSSFMSQFMGEAQSAQDGTCGIATCAFAQGVKNGQFWGPAGRNGAATALPLEEYYHDPASKDLLWEASVAACGGDIAIGAAVRRFALLTRLPLTRVNRVWVHVRACVSARSAIELVLCLRTPLSHLSLRALLPGHCSPRRPLCACALCSAI